MTASPSIDSASTLALARDTLAIEAQAISAMSARLDAGFVQAVQLVLDCSGRLVVTGMGKSGHVGRKIAATLASTGTPAMFVHPAEASHGDLGMITHDDLVLAISNSGESEELTAILPLIKRMGVPLLAMTGKAGSSLGRHADVVLDTGVAKEACPHNLAPTASTTAQLAMGDALAVFFCGEVILRACSRTLARCTGIAHCWLQRTPRGNKLDCALLGCREPGVDRVAGKYPLFGQALACAAAGHATPTERCCIRGAMAQCPNSCKTKTQE